MGSWSCPHDIDNVCQRVNGARCDPGMRGCVLHGRFRFARDEDGGVRKPVKALPDAPPMAQETKPKRQTVP
jgi:hypothetical protein